MPKRCFDYTLEFLCPRKPSVPANPLTDAQTQLDRTLEFLCPRKVSRKPSVPQTPCMATPFRSAASLFLLELNLDVAARRVSERLLCVLVEAVVPQTVATGA